MRIKMKSVISALLASVMLIGTIPAVTYAAQVNEYTDPADNWLKANGRTNELDMAAVYVRCQHIFIFAAQNLLRKLFPYLVRLFRRGLAGLKRLYQVPG